jgi:conjugal transfer/entry exclusion protein
VEEIIRTKASTEVLQRVAVLETQMVNVAHSVERIDAKVDIQYQSINTRISDMKDDIRSDMASHNDKLMSFLETHDRKGNEQMTAIQKRVEELERWRWMMIGASAVIGYVLAHVQVANLF